MLRAVLDILLPPACAACGLPGAAACAGCLATLRPLPGPRCAGCGAPVPGGRPVARCGDCRGRIAGARQAVHYSGAGPALITALKDRGRRDLAAVLAEVTARYVPAPPAGAVLVPVPPSARRRRTGTDHTALLAAALARRWHRPVAPVLRRVREAPPQRGASRSARLRQAAGGYAVARGAAAPRYPVLVDDVRTTGATLAACAAALHRAGAVRVGAVCPFRVAPETAHPSTVGGAARSVLSSKEGCDAAPGEGQERLRDGRPLRSRPAQARAADEDPAHRRGRRHHR